LSRSSRTYSYSLSSTGQFWQLAMRMATQSVRSNLSRSSRTYSYSLSSTGQ
jgi:hypothetical protein